MFSLVNEMVKCSLLNMIFILVIIFNLMNQILTITFVKEMGNTLPGLQPEMPDSVKLLLRDAKYLGIHTDSL